MVPMERPWSSSGTDRMLRKPDVAPRSRAGIARFGVARRRSGPAADRRSHGGCSAALHAGHREGTAHRVFCLRRQRAHAGQVHDIAVQPRGRAHVGPVHSVRARSAMASNTGCTSVGDSLITARISAVAVCRSSASCVSLNSRAFSIAISAWSREGLGHGDLLCAERRAAGSRRRPAGRYARCRAAAAGTAPSVRRRWSCIELLVRRQRDGRPVRQVQHLLRHDGARREVGGRVHRQVGRPHVVHRPPARGA